jgi:hypothetical protein
MMEAIILVIIIETSTSEKKGTLFVPCSTDTPLNILHDPF